MERKTIAAIATCHNRKDKTLASLDALFKQKLSDDVQLDVYLVDDGSIDGTTEAVLQTYPQVKMISGDGSLFWNGGMRVAFGEALKAYPDYYLWFNDDTDLYPNAVAKLLSTYQSLSDRGEGESIVVGATCDPETGKLTYGGMVQSSWWHPLKFQLLQPTQDPQPCHTMNGNCVLIPQKVARLGGQPRSQFHPQYRRSGLWTTGETSWRSSLVGPRLYRHLRHPCATGRLLGESTPDMARSL
ncbi:glycosyltransferase family 2 protein [Phormidium pseudopriestleyi]|uniref:glycosyltransferase family 2 protein n=1 Tax=Phormidium pseudopriestleyi TaxID=1759527 RepID=UPI0030F43D5B